MPYDLNRIASGDNIALTYAHLVSIMASSGTFKKWFSDKGFGFITPNDGGDDVFCHVKENGGDDAFSGVNAGDECNYDPEWDDRKGKYKATNVSGPTINAGGGGGGGGGWGKGGGKGDDRQSPYGGKGW